MAARYPPRSTHVAPVAALRTHSRGADDASRLPLRSRPYLRWNRTAPLRRGQSQGLLLITLGQRALVVQRAAPSPSFMRVCAPTLSWRPGSARPSNKYTTLLTSLMDETARNCQVLGSFFFFFPPFFDMERFTSQLQDKWECLLVSCCYYTIPSLYHQK